MEMRELIRKWIQWKSERSGAHFTQDMLARKAGIYSSNLSEYMTGKVEPNKRTLDKLARALGVSLAEFMTGPSDPGRVRSQFGEIPVYDQGGEQIDSFSDEQIPLLTSIPAGPWLTWVDTYPPGFGEDAVPRYGVKGGCIFAVRVQGDSMVPDLRPGDVLVIDPERAFTNTKGGIGVVKYDDSYKIRRIWLRGDNYLLEPSNKAYEPEFIPVAETTIFKIVEVRPRLDERF